MINIDKQKVNESINEAYENQTEKVRQLLESAKQNLEVQKGQNCDYTANKQKAVQLQGISRVITKKKEKENLIENRMDEKFESMQEKLNIHSKNLDVIFKNVAQNNENEIFSLQEIKKKQDESNQDIAQIAKKIEKQKIQQIENHREIKNSMQKNIEEAKTEIMQGQNTVQETLLNAHSSIEYNILSGQKEVEKNITRVQSILEQKIEQLQVENQEQLIEMKEEISKIYQKENKHAISTLIEERNAYLSELQEKDKEIRQLNYKIYEYEEKLEKEIARRQKVSIFAPFLRKESVAEEEAVYTSQILNYVY